MHAGQGDDVVGEILDKSRFWQVKNILIIFLLKIPTAFFMACIVYSAPVPKRVQVYCRGGANASEGYSWIYHPRVVDPNDQEFQLQLCDAHSDAVEKAFMHFGEGDRSPPWIKPATVAELVPCEYFGPNETLTTVFDVFCSRGALVVLTQGMHLVGIFLSGVVVRYSTRV